MTKAGVKKLISRLMVYYPAHYDPKMSTAVLQNVSGALSEAYEDYADKEIFEAYKALLTESPWAPAVSEIVAKVRELHPKPQTLPDVFMDGEGYTYKRKPDGSVECIGRPQGRVNTPEGRAFLEAKKAELAAKAARPQTFREEQGAIKEGAKEQ